MAINKVVYGNNTLIDLTNDTVEASNLLEGVTAHDRSGTPVNGTAKQGHTIKDGDGMAMTAQPNLQFADANVSNDGTNNATVVRNFVDIDWDDWQEVDDNDDTYYRVTDAPLVDGNVEVDLMKKLWENPAPTASFVAQNITLSSDDYDFLIIVYAYYAESLSTMRQFALWLPKGYSTNLTSNDTSNSGAAALSRAMTRNSDTSFSVGICYQAIGTSAQTTRTDALVPLAIYGIKQKVTISLSAIISNVSTSASKCMLSDGETSVEDTLNYSTEEHVVGKWIDGSDLYEKTVDCGALPNNTTKNVNHNISNIKYVVSASGVAVRNDNSSFKSLPYIWNVSQTIGLDISPIVITIVSTFNTSIYTGYVTIRYTKTS